MKWTEIEGYYKWPRYYESVVETYAGGVLVEVGCYLGRSLCHLATLVRESGKPFSVVGVDHCLGTGTERRVSGEKNGRTNAGELWDNVVACGLHDVVSVVVAESGRASEYFAPYSCAMVFLDAGHGYADVHRDIHLWASKVKLGGELSGDDYGTPTEPPVWPGVRRAVDELLPERRLVPHDAWAWRRR